MKIIKLCISLLVLFVSAQVGILEASSFAAAQQMNVKLNFHIQALNAKRQAEYVALDVAPRPVTDNSSCCDCWSNMSSDCRTSCLVVGGLLMAGGIVAFLVQLAPSLTADCNPASDGTSCFNMTALHPNPVKPSPITFTRDSSEIITAHPYNATNSNNRLADSLRKRKKK